MYQPPAPPVPPRPRNRKLVIIGIVVAGVLLNACICSNIIRSLSSQQKNPLSQPTTAQQEQQTQPTQQATQEAPASPTQQKPTATPKPLNQQERIEQILYDQFGDKVSNILYVEDKPNPPSINADVYIGPQWDTDGARTAIRIDCFNAQKAIWTAKPALKLRSVVIFLQGDFKDKYGKESRDQAGACTLKAATAKRFVWENMTHNDAWEAYDMASYHPALQQ